MEDQEPTVRSRELGLALQRAIGTVGLNQNELARLMSWSPSKVSRMINGKRCVSSEDVSAVLAIGRIVGPKRNELLDMARHATERGWWQEYGDRLPAELRTLSDHEYSAIAVTNFETTVIPGLLQTPDYMIGLLTADTTIPRSEITDRVHARQRRQIVFDRRYPAKFVFFIDEYALRRTGPGREIMSGQVHHLLRMSVRPYLAIRVVPDGVGFHAAQHPFMLMEFSEINPVVHIENLTSVLFVERKDSVAAYSRNIAALSKVALDEEQSRSWLADLASELGEERHAQRPAGIFELEEEFPE